MTLEFPSSPTNDQVYENYIYNSTAGAWQKLPGNAFADAAVSDTPPVNPNNGDLWLNSADAKMYIYYNDGDSSQWIAAVGGTVPQQGKILQVVSVAKTDTFSSSVSASGSVDVTDLSITHTLQNASNKLLISANFGVAATNEGRGRVGIAVADDGTLINIGDAASSRTRVGAGGITSIDVSTEQISTLSIQFLYSPGDTSAHTYTVKAININDSTQTLYVNRTQLDADSNGSPRGASNLIIQEVAA